MKGGGDRGEVWDEGEGCELTCPGSWTLSPIKATNHTGRVMLQADKGARERERERGGGRYSV
jgi:hypothetical protein